ncbi:MAG TPA: hypothetical protein PLZ43_15060 [bacterium]|nr:hypothetical protein [bacterium]
MKPKTELKTKAVIVGKEYHEAMDRFFEKRKIPKRFQVEMALLEFFKKEAREIYDFLIKKTKNPN